MSASNSKSAVALQSIPFSRSLSIQEIIRSNDLNTTEVCLLFALDSHCWGDKSRCWPSVATLASLVKKDERTIQRGLSSLKEKGLIVEEPAHNATGRQLVLTWKEVTKPVTNPKPSPPALAPKECHPNTKNPKQEKETTTEPRQKAGVVVLPFPTKEAPMQPSTLDPDLPDWDGPEDPDYPLTPENELEDDLDDAPDWWEDSPGLKVQGLPRSSRAFLDGLLTQSPSRKL